MACFAMIFFCIQQKGILTKITVLGGELLLQGDNFGLQRLVRSGRYRRLGSLFT
jgi:hypothetical protein